MALESPTRSWDRQEDLPRGTREEYGRRSADLDLNQAVTKDEGDDYDYQPYEEKPWQENTTGGGLSMQMETDNPRVYSPVRMEMSKGPSVSPVPKSRSASPIPRQMSSPHKVQIGSFTDGRFDSPGKTPPRQSSTPLRQRSPSPVRARLPSPAKNVSASPSRSASPANYTSASPTRHQLHSPTNSVPHVSRRSLSPAEHPSSPIRRRPASPAMQMSGSPGRHRSGSPRRYNSPSPERRRSASPRKYISPSPERHRPASPRRYMSPSPERHRSASPRRYMSPSPERHRSASPRKYKSPSPERHRPSLPRREIPSSPARHRSPVSRHVSPSLKRRYSPQEVRRKHDQSRSPVGRHGVSPGYGRGYHGRSRSRSPARNYYRRSPRGRYSPRNRYSPRRRSPQRYRPRHRSPRRRPWSPPPNRNTGLGKPGNNLFIAGFSFDTTERDLERKFSRFGKVTDVRVVRDKRSGDSRGFGFLTLERDEDADAAIRALDQTEWKGRIVLIEKAKTPTRY
ncbi:uncharacterized protein LOC131026993 [Cryptomeria japonica]|uniref:uncharacterized protein LOC131026993 n=1 Tax=Cryptomeria japonica TaxID=3369 RepID=UPI0027DA2CFB|nr:uncharacterized protein LOC131026993 [Cryptomeria japonica]XP_057812982.2 uncharacterized protein LOC131026993 [Cryptomeria japonica]XP_057812983.2 uncharacterized protein LOC131026993 [Cryptomeria japonica]XP_059067997.1 uncharacterized protein LOC131026993 [Cryptomeria japonica]